MWKINIVLFQKEEEERRFPCFHNNDAVLSFGIEKMENGVWMCCFGYFEKLQGKCVSFQQDNVRNKVIKSVLLSISLPIRVCSYPELSRTLPPKH